MSLKDKINALCIGAENGGVMLTSEVFLKPAGWARAKVVAAKTEEELIRALYGRSVWSLMGVRDLRNPLLYPAQAQQKQFAQVIRNYCPYLYESRSILQEVLKNTDAAKNKSAPDNFSKETQEKMTETHLQMDALVAQRQFYEMYFLENLHLWSQHFDNCPNLWPSFLGVGQNTRQIQSMVYTPVSYTHLTLPTN